MSTLVKLKQDLGFSQDLEDIIDVLKVASLIQFHAFRSKEGPDKNFLSEIESSFNLLSARKINHPYLCKRQGLPCAIVVVTSDEGFLGEQDILLINSSLEQRKSKNDEIIVLGERGARYLEELRENFIFFPGISPELKYTDVENLRNYLLKEYSARFAQVLIVYPEFLSLTAQKIRISPLLPYEFMGGQEAQVDYILKELLVEPSSDRAIEGLIELWAGAKLLDIFWSAKQSEYAARIMHLEGSAQELLHLNQKLAFDYFRLMHSLSDKAIREISSAKILLGKSSR